MTNLAFAADLLVLPTVSPAFNEKRPYVCAPGLAHTHLKACHIDTGLGLVHAYPNGRCPSKEHAHPSGDQLERGSIT